MSHIVQIQTEVRDVAAIQAACRRLGLPQPVNGVTKLYSSQATGWAVQLPDWRYPVVCDTASGQLQFDNFNGYWGQQAQLDRFMQAYTVEKAKLEVRKKGGYSVIEETRADRAIILNVQVMGGIFVTKIIKIIVSPAGQTTVETKGFTGASCQQASKFLELALGRTLAERLTPEFHHQAAQSSAEQRQQSG